MAVASEGEAASQEETVNMNGWDSEWSYGRQEEIGFSDL